MTQETEIEVTSVKCQQVDEILSSRMLASHHLRCLGGFTGRPDGQVFLLPVTAIVPVSPLETGEIPIQIKVDLERQKFLLAPTNLRYFGEEGVAEMETRGFSTNAIGALNTDEAADWTAPPDPCFYVKPTPLNCCHTNKVEVVAETSELSSSHIGPSGTVECTMSAMMVTATYPDCPGKPQQTSWAQTKSEDCPEMICQINVDPSVIDLFVCEEEQPVVTINCENKDGTPAPFTDSKFMPFWNNDNKYAAQVDPRTGKVKGLKEGLAHLEATWPIPDQGFIPGQAVVNVTSNIRSFLVDLAQETIKVGDGRILIAEIIGVEGNMLDPSTVTWSSSDPSIAYLIQDTGGLTSVEGRDCGTVIITAKYQHDCETVITTATITVEDHVSSCQVNPPAITLSVGQVTALEVIPYDAQGKVADIDPDLVTWSPSDAVTAWASPSVGLLTVVDANNIGQSTITATYQYPSANRCGQKRCQAQVTVNCELCTFEIIPSATVLILGNNTKILRAELRDVNGQLVNILPSATINWTTNSSGVSPSSTTGSEVNVTPNDEGPATITATYTDPYGQKTATAIVRVRSFQGVWDTYFLGYTIDGGPWLYSCPMGITVDGTTATGNYRYYTLRLGGIWVNGQLSGVISEDGYEFAGIYLDEGIGNLPPESGTFSFQLAPDGNSFTGYYTDFYNEEKDWYGNRR